MKRADLGLRPRSTRIHHPNRREILGVPSLHFRHMYNFVYRLEFIDASRRLCERERRSIIGLHPRSSFFSAHDASGLETNNHVQTRTAHAPEVYRHTNMAQCFRHVSPPRSPARKSTRITSPLSRLHGTNVLADARVPCTRVLAPICHTIRPKAPINRLERSRLFSSLHLDVTRKCMEAGNLR